MTKENAWSRYTDDDLKSLEALSTRYIRFLTACKTERECADEAVRLAKEAGFRDLAEVIAAGETLRPGDKVYTVNMGKAAALYIIGEKPLEEGMRILGAHIDSPRLDVKQVPAYEDSELAYLDTHYYGGIKKYQWVTIPLAIHGIAAKKDGTAVQIVIGEDPADPVFCVTDLLIHLAADQMAKKGTVVVEGENLDVLVGSRPLKGSDEGEGSETKKQKEAVRANFLRLLEDKYGIGEDDLLSAEFEVVPAGPARECGLDRSMIASYGHDDRVCAFTSLEAFLETGAPEYTACCLLVDKEEIGSVGATGMRSKFFENATAEVMNCTGGYSELKLRRCLRACRMLSSDVNAAYDPLYASVFEKKNSSYLGHGLVFNKYTGSRGKSGSNDANAEYMGWIRRVMDDGNVSFQTAELGRVDAGGGGTIAYISALYGMDVIDSGVAVLNMHAPMEIVSKADVYEAKKGYQAFLTAKQ